MSNRRRSGDPAPHPNHERWLISYADFITLLFAFFVVLYASSTSDHVKIRSLSKAIQTAFAELGLFSPTSPELRLDTAAVPASGQDKGNAAASATVPDPAVVQDRYNLAKLQYQLSQALAPEIRRHEVSFHLNRQGLVIRLEELGFFPSGSDQLSPTAMPMVAAIASSLGQLPNPVRIEGHTDDIPIHNQRFASNWELSTARAATLVQLLITQYQFSPERMAVAGYAQYHPIASNATEEGRQQNRRVDIVVVSLEAARASRPDALPNWPMSFVPVVPKAK